MVARRNKSNADIYKIGTDEQPPDLLSESQIVEYQLENIKELALPEESEAGDIKSEHEDRELLHKALMKNKEYQKELNNLKQIIEMQNKMVSRPIQNLYVP